MSTTFGVEVPSLHNDGKVDIEIVARRINGVRWVNSLAQLLPLDTKVIPMDNSHQGIYTIGDIWKEINKH